MPLLAGTFRIQRLSCKNCLNEVKQQSFLSYFEMEDEVFSFKVGKLAIILKRRTFIYGILLLLVGILTLLMFKSRFMSDPHSNVNEVLSRLAQLSGEDEEGEDSEIEEILIQAKTQNIFK
mmetsp:Transcript_7068/g.11905  ORF Transcript_7068/g.11905 Transcript_7068/m.11905 type:complete len:120 (-) Transcript_7068:8-367(-)